MLYCIVCCVVLCWVTPLLSVILGVREIAHKAGGLENVASCSAAHFPIGTCKASAVPPTLPRLTTVSLFCLCFSVSLSLSLLFSVSVSVSVSLSLTCYVWIDNVIKQMLLSSNFS